MSGAQGGGGKPAPDVTRRRESGDRRVDPGCRGDRPVAPTEEGRAQRRELPAEVAVEGDVLCGAAALRGAFTLDAQVDPRAEEGGRKVFRPYAGWSDSEEGITSRGGRRGRRAVPPRLLAQPCADVTRMPPASGSSGIHVPSADMPNPQQERQSGRPRRPTCAAWLCVWTTGLFIACDLFAPRSTDTTRSPRRYVRCRTSATPHPITPPMLWIVAAGIVGLTVALVTLLGRPGSIEATARRRPFDTE